jgi:hypothetical protein
VQARHEGLQDLVVVHRILLHHTVQLAVAEDNLAGHPGAGNPWAVAEDSQRRPY